MGKELEGLDKGPKAKIHLESFKATLRKVPNWKTPGHDVIHGLWFKKFNSIHVRLAIKMNRCLQETDILEWIT